MKSSFLAWVQRCIRNNEINSASDLWCLIPLTSTLALGISLAFINVQILKIARYKWNGCASNDGALSTLAINAIAFAVSVMILDTWWLRHVKFFRENTKYYLEVNHEFCRFFLEPTYAVMISLCFATLQNLAERLAQRMIVPSNKYQPTSRREFKMYIIKNKCCCTALVIHEYRPYLLTICTQCEQSCPSVSI